MGWEELPGLGGPSCDPARATALHVWPSQENTLEYIRSTFQIIAESESHACLHPCFFPCHTCKCPGLERRQGGHLSSLSSPKTSDTLEALKMSCEGLYVALS